PAKRRLPRRRPRSGLCFSPKRDRIPPYAQLGRIVGARTAGDVLTNREGESLMHVVASRGRRRRLFVSVIALAAVGSAFLAAQGLSARNASPLGVSPLSGGVLAAQALRAGTLGFSAGQLSAPEGVDVSVLPNVKANAGTQPANEVP